ncbi:uncharacterized protein LOC121431365 [Lytechinus variegatus]|uniref:uncharacterized protein LOC121431365 n=1 Tax=Lytechinus variegatus TaxID=7654 RepID=UPI001BB19BEA|nr:uncharacterized protein LOC121431365 [Lytechinus variegatus]
MTGNTPGSPGYENSIVGFHEATDGDTTDDLYGVVEKDAFSAQMKRGTMIVDYVNVKGEAGNTPAVAEPDHSYENMAADTTSNDAMTSKDVGGSDELYAMSTKHRLGPDGREVVKEEADMYAVPDKGRKSQPSRDALGKSLPVEKADDAGDLYAMPDKNRRSKNALTSSRSDDIEMMYAMPDKPRFGQLHDDDDTTEMVENELYG